MTALAIFASIALGVLLILYGMSARTKPEKLTDRLARECRMVERERKAQDSPYVRGYKHAMIGYEHGKLCYRPIRNSSVRTYETDDDAVCGLLREVEDNLDDDTQSALDVATLQHLDATKYEGLPLPHEADLSTGHHCGFYAAMRYDHVGVIPYSEPWDWNWMFAVVLEVELYGRVLVHEFCYRAEKQRVLCVYVPHTCCYSNGDDVCRARATHLACYNPQTVHYKDGDKLYPALMPVCNYHTEYAQDTGRRVYTLIDVANELHTRVMWNDQQPRFY